MGIFKRNGDAVLGACIATYVVAFTFVGFVDFLVIDPSDMSPSDAAYWGAWLGGATDGLLSVAGGFLALFGIFQVYRSESAERHGERLKSEKAAVLALGRSLDECEAALAKNCVGLIELLSKANIKKIKGRNHKAEILFEPKIREILNALSQNTQSDILVENEGYSHEEVEYIYSLARRVAVNCENFSADLSVEPKIFECLPEHFQVQFIDLQRGIVSLQLLSLRLNSM